MSIATCRVRFRSSSSSWPPCAPFLISVSRQTRSANLTEQLESLIREGAPIAAKLHEAMATLIDDAKRARAVKRFDTEIPEGWPC